MTGPGGFVMIISSWNVHQGCPLYFEPKAGVPPCPITAIRHSLYSAFAILAFAFIIACANTPYLFGKWKEIGKAATLELRKDGTFKAVDNQKMAVSGKYTLSEHRNIRFEIFRQGSPSEIVNGKYSVQGDILTFTSADGKEIERYKREHWDSPVKGRIDSQLFTIL